MSRAEGIIPEMKYLDSHRCALSTSQSVNQLDSVQWNERSHLLAYLTDDWIHIVNVDTFFREGHNLNYSSNTGFISSNRNCCKS